MTLTRLDITTDPTLAVPHGFFGRRGGASSGVFEGLNCGPGSADQADMVAINRARVAAAMEVAPTHLVTLRQVHSARVVRLDAPPEAPAEADAMVTTVPGLALGVLTADCQPILFADAAAGVVGAAHAGWRGALGGVIDATVAAMVAAGARPEGITAVIGPAISQAAYEVGPDLRAAVVDEDPDAAAYFAPGDADRLMFDLPGYGGHRLSRAGVGRAVWTGHCTYGDAARFYSYRRSTHQGAADYGRLISVIRL